MMWLWVKMNPPRYGPQVLVQLFPFARATHFGSVFLTHSPVFRERSVSNPKVAPGYRSLATSTSSTVWGVRGSLFFVVHHPETCSLAYVFFLFSTG